MVRVRGRSRAAPAAWLPAGCLRANEEVSGAGKTRWGLRCSKSFAQQWHSLDLGWTEVRVMATLLVVYPETCGRCRWGLLGTVLALLPPSSCAGGLAGPAYERVLSE